MPVEIVGEEDLISLDGRGASLDPDTFTIEGLPAVSAEQAEIRYINEPILPEAAVVAFTGNSGCGKSTLATALVRDAIETGRPCLVLDRENPRPVVLDRMNRLGLQDGPLPRWAGGWLHEDPPGPDSRTVHAWIERCALKPLIVVDSVAAFMAGDENSAREMRAFMNGPRKLADLGECVVLIHHDGKSETARDFRGSSDFKASVDQAFHVTNVSADQRLDRLRLRVFKSRYGAMDNITFRYADGRMIPEIAPDAAARMQSERFTELLRVNPNIGQAAFERLAIRNDLGRNRARRFLDDGVQAGLIDRREGARHQFSYLLLGGRN